MRKRVLAVLAAVLTAFSAASCGGSSSSGESRAEAASSAVSQGDESAGEKEGAQTTLPEDSEPVPDTTTEPEPVLEPLSSPYAAVEGFDVSGSIYGLEASSDGKLAVCCRSEKGIEYHIVDPEKGEMLRSGELAGDCETLLGLRPDGTVITNDAAEQKIYFYSEGSDQPRVLEYPRSIVDLRYYAPEDRLIDFSRSISEIDMETGNITELFGIKEDVSEILEVDLSGGLFIANVLSTDCNDSLRSAVFSLTDGKKLAELPLYNQSLFSFIKTGIVCEDSDPNSEQRLFLSFDRPEGESLDCFVSTEDSAKAYSSLYSDCLMMSASNISGESWETYVKVLDIESGTMGELHFGGDMAMGIMLGTSVQGRWFAAVTLGDSSEDQHTQLVMLEPTLAENVSELEKTSLPKIEEKETHTAGEWFEEHKKQADEIEKKYGVEICLGDEALDLPENNEYRFVPQSSENSQHESITEQLDMLDECLSRYPEGFFKKFCGSVGGGIRFTPVERLENLDEFSVFTAGGVTWESGAWVDIAFCGPDFSFYPQLMDHEIWHAVEIIVERKTPIDNAAWEELNPEGFTYYENTNTYDGGNDDEEYLLVSDDPYFIRDYSKINIYEDRATLIEEIASGDTKTSYEKLCEYPHLKAKLDFLADWIRPYFGYVYFEE